MEKFYLCPPENTHCSCCHDKHAEALAHLKLKLHKLLCPKECTCILASTYFRGEHQETVIMFNEGCSSKMNIRCIPKSPEEIQDQELMDLIEKPMELPSFLYILTLKHFSKGL